MISIDTSSPYSSPPRPTLKGYTLSSDMISVFRKSRETTTPYTAVFSPLEKD